MCYWQILYVLIKNDREVKVIYKQRGHLVAFCLLIGNWMDLPVIEAKNLRTGKA